MKNEEETLDGVVIWLREINRNLCVIRELLKPTKPKMVSSVSIQKEKPPKPEPVGLI